MNREDVFMLLKGYNNTLGYKVKLAKDEFLAMKQEFNLYNKHAHIVEDGLAPLSSYKYEDDRDQLLFARYNLSTYSKIFKKPGRWAYEDGIEYEFHIYSPKYESWTIYYEDDIKCVAIPTYDEETREYDTIDCEYDAIIPNDTEWMNSFRIFEEIITNKYDRNSEYAIGYSLLPMTKKLLKDKII